MNLENNFDNFSGINMPFSLDAEQSVLGAILIEPSCFERVLDYLKPESFYIPQNKAVFTAISRLFALNIQIDFVTVLEELKRDGTYSEGEGRAYLTQLAELVPSISNVEAYAKIVREKFYARSLVAASKEIMELASTGQDDSNTLLDLAEQRIYDIRQGRETTGLVHIKEVIVNETFERLNKLNSADREEYLGISTGLSGIDSITTGLNKSDLIILAARPGVGKTSFALNVAHNVAVRSNRAVAIFSFEMSREQLVQRFLSSEASIQGERFKMGNLSDDEWTRLAEAGSILSNSPIYIDDTSNLSVSQMKAKLRRLKNVGLVVIDYLQLMSMGGKYANNRVQEISEITRNLKIMAKELNVPVLTLSQLSRNSEQRAEHRPVLSDLRDSGSIEQDADIVMFLYREAMHTKDKETQAALKNSAECIIEKNRHGARGIVELFWDGEFTRFSTKEVRYERN